MRRIEQLRRKRLIGAAIAGKSRMALSTVRGILRRLGLGRLKYLGPKEPVVRYERDRPGERKESAIGFLERATAWLRRRGVEVERVSTDNGSVYCSYAFADACVVLGARHSRTRPYRPQTNGKVERFIQTMLRQWAYVKPYRSAGVRAKARGPWLEYYNRVKPHGSPGGKTPYDRLRARL